MKTPAIHLVKSAVSVCDARDTIRFTHQYWAHHENLMIGSVAPGYLADIIAVKGNPLNDVSILENVNFVMKECVVYKSPE